MEEQQNSFKIQNQKMILTYDNTHMDKKMAELYFRTKWPNHPIKFWRAAHEIAPTTEMKHTHVLINWGKRFQSKDCRVFDYEGVHPNIKTINTITHWKQCMKYLAKEDPENEDLKEEENSVVGVWESSTLQEALMKYPIGLANQVVTAWENRGQQELEIERLDFGWYNQFDRLREDHRSVYWIYDEIGNVGKSALCKYLMNQKEWYVVKGNLQMRDFATVIENALEKWGSGKGNIAIDLPRTSEEHTSIYSCIEAMRDGFITSSKYKGRTHLFDIGKVVVFCNFKPRVQNLSVDRWQIYEIINKDEMIWKCPFQIMDDDGLISGRGLGKVVGFVSGERVRDNNDPI